MTMNETILFIFVPGLIGMIAAKLGMKFRGALALAVIANIALWYYFYG